MTEWWQGFIWGFLFASAGTLFNALVRWWRDERMRENLKNLRK